MTKIRAKVGDYDYTININVDNKRENQKKWNDLLNNFEKLVLFKALREEKVKNKMSILLHEIKFCKNFSFAVGFRNV